MRGLLKALYDPAQKSYLVGAQEFRRRAAALKESSGAGKHCIGAATHLIGLYAQEPHLEPATIGELGLEETTRSAASLVGFVIEDWTNDRQEPPMAVVHLAAIDPLDRGTIHHRPAVHEPYEAASIEELLASKQRYETVVKQPHLPYLFSTRVAYLRPKRDKR